MNDPRWKNNIREVGTHSQTFAAQWDTALKYLFSPVKNTELLYCAPDYFIFFKYFIQGKLEDLDMSWTPFLNCVTQLDMFSN